MSDAAAQNHWGFANGSEHPGLPKQVLLAPPEATCRIFDPAWKAIHNHGIAFAIDHIFKLTDHSNQTGGRKPALENRELYPLAVLLADSGNVLESRCPNSFRISNVVRDEDVHCFKAV